MKKGILFLALIICAVVLTFAQQTESTGPQPQYWPVCSSPQNIGPAQNMGCSWAGYRSSIAWNGRDYAAVWIDFMTDNRPRFRRFYADGTPAGPAVVISTMLSDTSPKIVWNGNGYGVALAAYGGTYYEIFFLKLDTAGNVISGPTKVSFVGTTETTHCYNPDVAYSGNGYCVVWNDGRNGYDDIFATLLDSNGAITHSDKAVSTENLYQRTPRVAWTAAQGGMYQIVWMDYRSGTEYQIYGDMLSPDNWLWGCCQLTFVPPTYFTGWPVVANMGNGMGMAWDDMRDGNEEIYFARLTNDGCKLGNDLRITTDTAVSTRPALVWTGAEFGVLWQDDRTGNYETWFQRISASGTAIGGNVQVTSSYGTEWPDAAFARYGYAVTGADSGGGNYLSPWGCAADTTPPSCPTNLLAYNVSGTQATVSWGLSGDNETDIAYYTVFRNNNEIAKTSGNFYTDTGLSPNTTYNYMVQPVNAAQMQNYTCGTSVYTKTSSSFMLFVDKNDPNAHLYWDDIGLNNYNVFRGTSPQVMSLIGSTSECSQDDNNVLLDRNNYFYTVDDPGE